jgi:phosphoadenosine phosphosulfate reductase
VETYGEKLTMNVSFGNPEGMVLLDMASCIPQARKVRVFTLDTGLLFGETADFREQVRERYGLNLDVLRPRLSVPQQAESTGRGCMVQAAGPVLPDA